MSRKVRCIACLYEMDRHCSTKHRNPLVKLKKWRKCDLYIEEVIKFVDAEQKPLSSSFRPFWYWFSNREKKELSVKETKGVIPS